MSTVFVDGTTPLNAATLNPFFAAKVDKDGVVAAATRIFANKLAAGDANVAFQVNGLGAFSWGAGGASAMDLTMNRRSAGLMRVGGAFEITGTVTSAVTGEKIVLGTDASITFGAAQDVVLLRNGAGTLRAAADMEIDRTLAVNWGASGQVFFPPYANPTIEFGPARDTNLYRSAAGILKTDGKVIVGTVVPVSDALLSAVGARNGIEFGHGNPAGYRSILGAYDGNGQPFLAFYAQHGTNTNTFKTTGFAASVILGDGAGGFQFGTVANPNADNQGAVPVATLSAAGVLNVKGGLQINGVPLGVGGVDYIGNWGAGVTYKQGDVVRYNGVDYMAVNPSTGQTPPAASPLVAVPVTVLPASPFDTQRVILVDSLAAPTYAWQLQWSAAAACWVFVGGSTLSQNVQANVSSSSAAYGDLAGGPSVTVPRAGVYEIGWGAHVYEPVANAYMDMGLKVGAAAVAEFVRNRGAVGDTISVGRNGLRKTCAAADVLKCQYKSDGVNSGQWSDRWLTVIPVTLT